MLTAAPEAPALRSAITVPSAKTYPECQVACADELEAVILRERPETVAAFIAEPVLGASAGAFVPPEDYARKAREICSRHGVVYIDDEVMTGFGRTGAFFGIEWSGVSPDLVTCGKGMSGGYMPVGAVLASERIVAALERASGFTHGFTFSHNPVTAAACLETLRILEDEDLVERSRTLGERLLSRLAPLRSRPHVGDVRGRGLMARGRARGRQGHASTLRSRRARRPRAVTARCLRARARGLPEHRLRRRHERRPRDAGSAPS